jgi:hypothetical protein
LHHVWGGKYTGGYRREEADVPQLSKRDISEIDRQLEERLRAELGLDGSEELKKVKKAADRLERAQESLDDAILTAYDTGNVGARKIAEQAKVSHMTVMRLVRKRTGVQPRSDRPRNL